MRKLYLGLFIMGMLFATASCGADLTRKIGQTETVSDEKVILEEEEQKQEEQKRFEEEQKRKEEIARKKKEMVIFLNKY